jgi:hypothetical protein
VHDEYLDGEEEDWMGSLLPLREDLLRGDYRCLYLAWLRCVQEEEVEDDEMEPPLPPGLAEDSGSLSAFSSFFEIDHDLIEAAAEASAPAPSGPSRCGLGGEHPWRGEGRAVVRCGLRRSPRSRSGIASPVPRRQATGDGSEGAPFRPENGGRASRRLALTHP